MHILLFFTFDVSLKHWFDMGFAERELLIYHRFVKQGYKVTFLTYGDTRDLVFQKKTKKIRIIPVYHYHKRPNSLLIRLLQSFYIPYSFKGIMMKADIYKTNQMYGSWIPVLSKALYRKKLIVRCGYEYTLDALLRTRNTTVRTLESIPRYILELVVYRCADVIVLSSKFAKQFVVKYFRISDGKIRILSNYVDTRQFSQFPCRDRDVSNRMVFVGRLHPAKNVFSLLEAIENTAYELDLIGDGVQREMLRDFVIGRKINARFLGIVSHEKLARLLPKYSIFILPSIYENNPKALLEAMACGLPVIASNIPGVREIVKHEKNGLLCDPTSVSIRQAIDTLMQFPVLRKKLGRNARNDVERKHSIDMIAVCERKLYEQLGNCSK